MNNFQTRFAILNHSENCGSTLRLWNTLLKISILLHKWAKGPFSLATFVCTVRPRKWRIFSPAKTQSFAKTAIFEALVWFTRFRGYVLFLQISNSKFYIEMTLHYISVLFERPCNLLYKLWLSQCKSLCYIAETDLFEPFLLSFGNKYMFNYLLLNQQSSV